MYVAGNVYHTFRYFFHRDVGADDLLIYYELGYYMEACVFKGGFGEYIVIAFGEDKACSGVAFEECGEGKPFVVEIAMEQIAQENDSAGMIGAHECLQFDQLLFYSRMRHVYTMLAKMCSLAQVPIGQQ